MTKVDHVTYQVPYGALSRDQIGEFFRLLRMKEVEPDGHIEKDWKVRWFEDDEGFQVHLVEPENNQLQPQDVNLALGHLCVLVTGADYDLASQSILCTRNSGSGRIWLDGPCGLRAEVRPIPEGVAALVSIRSSTQVQELVLRRALAIFEQRNEQHQDNWRREGWRGALFNLRRKAERAWDALWDLDPNDLDSQYLDQHLDDALDCINYAALIVRAIEEGNRDGTGGWWPAERNNDGGK